MGRDLKPTGPWPERSQGLKLSPSLIESLGYDLSPLGLGSNIPKGQS